MNKTLLCLLSCLLVINIIQVVHCTIESEVIEELPIDFPSPELPKDISEPIKAGFTKPFRSQGRMYPHTD